MSERTIDNALTRDELDSLKPPTEELFNNTWRAIKWYNEATWTAAALMVEAAESSDRFREVFVNEEMTDKPAFPDSDETVKMQVWRYTIDQDCPDVADRLWGIDLSAFQGSAAESIARKHLEQNR